MRYDLIVLGNNPIGLEGALAAVQLNKRVAVVALRETHIGRAHAPSHAALREAALMLTEFRYQGASSDRLARRRNVTASQLRKVSNEIESKKSASIEQKLRDHGADFLAGSARFLGHHDLEITSATDESKHLISDKFLLAVGTQSARPNRIPFDGESILDSDEVLSLDRIPKSMIVVGGGHVALECAMTFALVGTRIAVVDDQRQLLEHCDREIVRVLRQQAANLGMRFRLGRSINSIEKTVDNRAAVRLEGGKNLIAECVVYASMQQGLTDELNLSAAGLEPDEHGRLWCNEYGQTWVKHIYGAGEVVGFPTVAGQALEQGSRAVQHAFGQPVTGAEPMACGLRTIPELAMVGATEQQLSHDLVAYEVGVARLRDTSRGHCSGAENGILKLLFHRESLELLGVHCLGESACELIRIGQTVMSLGGTIESFCGNSFDHSALTECYRIAANDGLRRLEEESATSEATLRLWRPKSRRRRLVPSLS